MHPVGFQNPLDPFRGAGMAGDPMEAVLSLQTLDSADALAIDYNYNSRSCSDVGDTASCSTGTCNTVGTTSSCSTDVCTHQAVIG